MLCTLCKEDGANNHRWKGKDTRPMSVETCIFVLGLYFGRGRVSEQRLVSHVIVVIHPLNDTSNKVFSLGTGPLINVRLESLNGNARETISYFNESKTLVTDSHYSALSTPVHKNWKPLSDSIYYKTRQCKTLWKHDNNLLLTAKRVFSCTCKTDIFT